MPSSIRPVSASHTNGISLVLRCEHKTFADPIRLPSVIWSLPRYTASSFVGCRSSVGLTYYISMSFYMRHFCLSFVLILRCNVDSSLMLSCPPISLPRRTLGVTVTWPRFLRVGLGKLVLMFWCIGNSEHRSYH